MNGQVSDLMKQRKEKKPNPALKRLEKSLGAQENIWARIPRDSQEFGILEICNKVRLGLRHFKGGMPRNTRNKNRYALFSHPIMG